MAILALGRDDFNSRAWRPSRPLRKRYWRRKWGTLCLLAFLCAVIFVYNFATDAERVRTMAESYLATLTGGRVEVDKATLSIFEGLRLDGVRVYVDDGESAVKPPRDSAFFSAQTFVVRYHPRSILLGELEATQIIAQKPQVRLIENVDRREWNFQRLGKPKRVMTPSRRGGRPQHLPELLLRNARVQITELRGGKASQRGHMTLDGRLSPSEEVGRYVFALQSRGASEGLGPRVSGTVTPGAGRVSAQLRDFQFGGDVRAMLPAVVRQWWERHALSGGVDVDVSYVKSQEGRPVDFTVASAMHGVTLRVHPEEWLGREELRRLESGRQSVAAMRRLYQIAGWRVQKPLEVAARLMEPMPVEMKDVTGSIRFTPDRIEVDGLAVHADDNTLKIDGHIDGYSPDAAASLQIASPRDRNLVIPPSPSFVGSLPRSARELYELFRPQGQCALWVEWNRAAMGDRPSVRGRIDAFGGQFVFAKFPYPLRDVSGRVEFGRDDTGMDRMSVHMRGRGAADGPNRDTYFTIDSFGEQIGPIATHICGVNVRIAGKSARSDPLLFAALPPDVRKAIQLFDAPGKGEYPTLYGDFACDVVRPIGVDQRWSFDTDLHIVDAAAMLSAFPYPLSKGGGVLRIRTGFCDVVDVVMKRGDATLKLDGRVVWGRGIDGNWPQSPDRTRLRVQVQGAPIDAALLAALPEDRRDWLRKIGLGGKLDVDGFIFQPVGPGRPEHPERIEDVAFDYDLNLRLREGTIWPSDTTFSIDQAAGEFRLRSQSLDVVSLRGRHGDAEMSGGGSIGWSNGTAEANLEVSASRVPLDAALYSFLPTAGRKAWDEVRPEGVIDATVRYRGPLDAAHSIGAADSAAASLLDMTLKPRDLAVTVQAAPYRLEKITKGLVTLRDGKVTFEDLVGWHDGGFVSIGGVGVLGAKPQWDLHLSARDLPADEALRRALPTTLASLIESLKFTGRVGFDLNKFIYAQEDPPPPSARGVARPTEFSLDAAGKIFMADAAFEPGVAITDARGALDLSASVRRGSLATLRGEMKLDTLKMAGRAVSDFAVELLKPIGRSEIQFNRIRGAVAGGSLGGDVSVLYPERGPSKYRLSMVVRDADVRALAWESEKEVDGRLTASLALEGSWGDAAARRGRGDVLVTGRNMYRIPLILGLLQVTNLALPISSPFNEASAQYSVDGQRVTFEQIRLRSDTMVMNGDGHLDFDRKRVSLSFTTDNPGGLKVPFLHELWQGARNEMLRIRVNGSIEEPKVSATSMGTFWTTVDEVFKGDAPQKRDKN